jgi:hypothetical protein
MNQRIAEIMRNHGLQKNISEDCQHRIEMLAELIVRECIEICLTGTDTQMTCEGAAQKIKQHFGVE